SQWGKAGSLSLKIRNTTRMPTLNLTQTCSPTEDFVPHFKGMCYVTNGTGNVWLVATEIYKEEILSFDNDVAVLVVVTAGAVSARSWNSQKDLPEECQARWTLCRHNYTVQWRGDFRMVGSTVTMFPARIEALNHHNLMVYSVINIYSCQVKVTWFQKKRGKDSWSCVYTCYSEWRLNLLGFCDAKNNTTVWRCPHLPRLHIRTRVPKPPESPRLQSPIILDSWRLLVGL
uniref:MHC class II beta chain N-terminal domain-containing protein n=1 Tax=Ailuropoda melanoleuca TaxID=9646 RepID=A0A7N5KQ49_AILME